MLTIPTQGALYHLLYIPITTSYHNFHSLTVIVRSRLSIVSRFSSWHKIGITIFCCCLKLLIANFYDLFKNQFVLLRNWYFGLSIWNGHIFFSIDILDLTEVKLCGTGSVFLVYFFVAGLVTQSFATWRKSPKNFKIIYF